MARKYLENMWLARYTKILIASVSAEGRKSVHMFPREGAVAAKAGSDARTL
jgi:hypothetical protein